MAILHGSWIFQPQESYFFLWGETWRTQNNREGEQETQRQPSATTPGTHPYGMTPDELLACVSARKLTLLGDPETGKTEQWAKKVLAVPSRGGKKRQGRKSKSQKRHSGKPDPEEILPVLSGADDEIADMKALSLQWWEVTGLKLTPQGAAHFLQQLPLGTLKVRKAYLADSLRFWSQVYRWQLHLLTRGKFVPGLAGQRSCWQPLLDNGEDQARLLKFADLMPSVCRAYRDKELVWADPDWQDNWGEPQTLLLDFLRTLTDTQLRQWLELTVPQQRDAITPPWLQSLFTPGGEIKAPAESLKRLDKALDNWTFALQDYLVTPQTEKFGGNQFRVCFVLTPPTDAERSWGQTDWILSYYLRAVSDPDCLLNASEIWKNPVDQLTYQGYTIDNPQETLLKGLGLAAKFYDPIKESLNQPQPERCILNPIEVYEFIRASAWQLQDSGFSLDLPPGLSSGSDENRLGIKIFAAVKRKKGERLGLKTPLNYQLELAIGEKTISEKEFEGLLDQKSPIVKINEEWLALQPADVRAAQAVLSPDKNEDLMLTVEEALRLTTGDLKVFAKLPVVKFEPLGMLKKLIETLTENRQLEPIETPQDFHGELRPYQSRGLGWLASLEQWSLGSCLADDMGLGKTPQLIAFLLHLKEEEALNKPALVVCPTSVLGNWEREVQKFAPKLSVFVHHGDKRKKGKEFKILVQKKELVITSYSLVFRDLKTLNAVDWEGVILDEAQNIKNPQAKQSQAVRELNAGFRVALTGTPLENRLSELWSILDFLNPGFLGTKQFFQRRFAIPIEKYGDRDSLNALRSLVQPFILRRLKTDKAIIQDLPEKQEMNVFCGLSSEQAKLYQQVVDTSLEDIEESKGIKRHGLILTLLTKLKQICNHPAQYLKQKGLGKGERSGKLLRLQEMLEEVVSEGDRALIFTQFAEWGKLLKPYLEYKLDTQVLFLYGATKRADRQAMIDRFQNDPDGPPIFLLSLKAGGTGLNLTRANHVFHVDRWWNPAVENQATDRAFRIGQERNVQVHKFVCTGTLEERINDIIESKKQLAEQTVDAGEQWLTEMNTDQLRDLLLLDRDAIMDEE